MLTFHPPVIGHRGAKAVAPENTMASFRRAYQQGASWIETDVKLTRDGVAILMHDDVLDRTTNGKGEVKQLDWNDIQSLDAGSWFNPEFAGEKIPRLADLLPFVLDHGLHINLEIKPCLGRSQATAMVTLIETAKVWPRDAPPPLISSFDIDSLIVASQLHPEWPRGFLFEEWPENLAATIQMAQPSTLGVDDKILTPERINILKKTGLPLLVYTVNDPLRMKELLALGVAAVFSDNPASMIEKL